MVIREILTLEYYFMQNAPEDILETDISEREVIK